MHYRRRESQHIMSRTKIGRKRPSSAMVRRSMIAKSNMISALKSDESALNLVAECRSFLNLVSRILSDDDEEAFSLIISAMKCYRFDHESTLRRWNTRNHPANRRLPLTLPLDDKTTRAETMTLRMNVLHPNFTANSQ